MRTVLQAACFVGLMSLPTLCGCAQETSELSEELSLSEEAALRANECNAPQYAKAFDLCNYQPGSKWAPKCVGLGQHILQGSALDLDISAIKVAKGNQVEVFDSADATKPLSVVDTQQDYCRTPNNDRTRKLVVKRLGDDGRSDGGGDGNAGNGDGDDPGVDDVPGGPSSGC